MTNAFNSMTFPCGKVMSNRLMMAPLTNMQSHADGVLSADEYRWLSMRADGGFGAVMTAATYVSPVGQGYPGQIAIYGDKHIPELSRLTQTIKVQQSLSLVQLFHAGVRVIDEVLDVNGYERLAPSADTKTHSREMTHAEVLETIEDFIVAAERAKQAGFDGVEVHAAHDYLICRFLSAEFNQRKDEFGGSLANRSRMLFTILDGIRQRCGHDFIVGVRLTVERNGILLADAVELFKQLVSGRRVDFIDLSLWDVEKEPAEDAYAGKPLMSYFTSLERGDIKLGVAGKIYSADTVNHCLNAGADFVLLGRGAILHHDFPKLMQANQSFNCVATPVNHAYLQSEGLNQGFINYLQSTWPDFVEN